MNAEPVIIWCTCPDRHTADTIARHLVDQRLAACVNLLPGVTSVYRWRAKVEKGEEIMLMIKTRASAWGELEAAVQALHPYEVPELLMVPVAGGAETYLAWLAESTE